jgi:hypothetical protein
MLSVLLAAAIVSFAPNPDTAGAAPDAPAAATAGAVQPEVKKKTVRVCRREEAGGASRLAKKICVDKVVEDDGGKKDAPKS